MLEKTNTSHSMAEFIFGIFLYCQILVDSVLLEGDLFAAVYMNREAVPWFGHCFGSRQSYVLNWERIFIELPISSKLTTGITSVFKLKPLSPSLKCLFLRRRRRGAAEGHKPLGDKIPVSSHISFQQLHRSGRRRWHNWAQQDPAQRNLPPFQTIE